MALSAVAVPERMVTGGVMMRAHVQGPLGHSRLTEPVSPERVVMLTEAVMPALATMSSKSRSRLPPRVTVLPTVKVDPWVAVQPTSLGVNFHPFFADGQRDDGRG